MEISRTAMKLERSGKLESLMLLDDSEKIKRLEELSNYRKNLFNKDVDFKDVMWGLKREYSLVRYSGTLITTGPGLIDSFFFDVKPEPFINDKIHNDRKNGFHSTRKLINTGILGHIDEPLGKWIPQHDGKGRVDEPMGKWMPRNDGSGGWVVPIDNGRSAEV